MAWYVYMVRCRDGSLYCGISKDVLRRIEEHNNSTRGSRYTRARRFWQYKRRRSEAQEPTDPLLCNQSRRRISKRRVQFAWTTWQEKAGFDRPYPFRVLQHAAVANA